MEGSGFWNGFLVGFLAAGILGFLAAQARFFWKRFGQVSRTQTVLLHTQESPLQVLMKSLQAGFILLLMLAALVLAVWLAAQG